MNVREIKMPIGEAREKYLEYLRALRRTRSEGKQRTYDLMLKDAYRELARGRRLLNLFDVMRVAGVDERGRPKLAVARATIERVEFGWKQNPRTSGYHPVFSDYDGYSSSPCDIHKNVVLPTVTFPLPSWERRRETHVAIVPTIPMKFRPNARVLDDYHILWEATWDSPPVDPILLRRVNRLIFAVVAQWDLTELEQSVLGLVRA